MNLNELVNRIQNHDNDALEELEGMLPYNAEVAGERAWYTILNIEGTPIPDLCIKLFIVLLTAWGEARVRSLILSEWATLSELCHINICYSVSSHHGMSTELAMTLFNHSKTTTHERHLIAAGMARTYRERNLAGDFVVSVLSKIGTYPDKHRQQILESFVGRTMKSLGR